MCPENFFTTMICFMSTYDNNLNNIQINSKPLDMNAELSCTAEAQSFNKKVSELVDLAEQNDNFCEGIVNDIDELKVLLGVNPNLVKGRSKRETVDTIDILTHSHFTCKIPAIGIKNNNAKVLPITVQCESNQYGDGWILFATLDADHRNLNEKSTNEFINGFGGFTNSEKVREYFLGLKRLHEITIESGEHELLILIYNVDHWKKTHTHYMRYKRFSVAGADNDYRLEVLGGYDGDINDTLQAFLGEPFLRTMLSMERRGAVTMFVRSVNAKWN